MSLSDLSMEELRQLRDALATERIASPVTSRGLGAAGFDRFRTRVAILEGLDHKRAKQILDLLLEERARRAPPPELVWTGPEAATATARDTEVVLRRLFENAQREVILAGYSFDHGEAILRPLHTAMVERGVSALFFLDVNKRARVASEIASFATKKLREFLIENWKFGDPLPAIYYDPRTISPTHRSSLHAKCVIVDERAAFITSANFTNRGQTRNIEVGVLIEEPAFASQLAEQWKGLVRAGLVLRYEG